MTVGKVKDFNFSSGGMAKGYAKGGKVTEAPRMMRKEVIQRETVKAPAAPQGMLKNRGALGVIANKNPGETAMHTAPKLPGKMMMNRGGSAMSKGGMTKPMKSTSTEDKMMGKSPENYSSVTGAGGGSKPIDMYEMAAFKKGGSAMSKGGKMGKSNC
jgi:hypothetical protein